MAMSIDAFAQDDDDAESLAKRLQAMISVSEALVSVAEPGRHYTLVSWTFYLMHFPRRTAVI